MKNDFLKNSSQRVLFSAMMVSALVAGNVAPMHAEVTSVQSVLQSVSVKGQVLDAEGIPVIGASVLEKGTTNGVITDIDGNYSLNVSSKNAVVVISYIGYKTVELPASNPNLSKVILKEDTEVLDEVVVVGYGAQKKQTLTGSVTVVDEKMFQNKGTVSNPLSAMQGQVPGLRITRSSAAPGEEGWGISIRGAVSKNSVDPLLIIDGVPASSVSEMSQLSADDIESINFLKDASAAIYGAKAAGGVILVTTKRPDAGKAKIEYSGSFTRKIVGLQPRLMSLDEWADGVIQARTNDGYGEDDQWIRYAKLAKSLKGSWINLNGGDGSVPNPIPNAFIGVADFVFHDMNWTDVLWGNANSTQHNLSLSGGTDKSSYRLSLGYLNDQGTLQWGNNSNERYNVRLSNSFKISNRVSLDSNMAASRQHQVAPTQIGAVLGVSIPQPGLPVSTIDGKPYAWGGIHTPNWQVELGGDNRLTVTSMSVNEVLKINILEGLDFQGTVGYSTNTAMRDEQYLSIDWYQYDGTLIRNENSPYPAQEKSSYMKSASRTDNCTASAFLTYKKLLNEVHDLAVMGGVQYDYAAYDYSATKVMDVESAIESPGSGHRSHPAVPLAVGRRPYRRSSAASALPCSPYRHMAQDGTHRPRRRTERLPGRNGPQHPALRRPADRRHPARQNPVLTTVGTCRSRINRTSQRVSCPISEIPTIPTQSRTQRPSHGRPTAPSPETDRPQTIDLPDRDSPASQKRGSDPYKLEPPEIETSAKDASRLCPAKRRKTHN